MSMTEEQFNRLPKFAQEEIKILRRLAENHIKALNDHLDSEKESPVFYEDWMWDGKTNHSKRFNIQNDLVKFSIGSGVIHAYLRDRELQITWMRGDFALVPRSGNVFHIVELNPQP